MSLLKAGDSGDEAGLRIIVREEKKGLATVVLCNRVIDWMVNARANAQSSIQMSEGAAGAATPGPFVRYGQGEVCVAQVVVEGCVLHWKCGGVINLQCAPIAVR